MKWESCLGCKTFCFRDGRFCVGDSMFICGGVMISSVCFYAGSFSKVNEAHAKFMTNIQRMGSQHDVHQGAQCIGGEEYKMLC